MTQHYEYFQQLTCRQAKECSNIVIAMRFKDFQLTTSSTGINWSRNEAEEEEKEEEIFV